MKIKGTWREVADAANTTVNKEEGTKEPSSLWKRRMLLCEHSPIRHLMVSHKWKNLKYWVSVHLTRHKYGIEHWVRTQRTDRTNVDRNDLPQGALVEHEILVNAQALINISRKRLCNLASPETRKAWYELKGKIQEKEPELAAVMVADCIYRGYCYEFKSCGYHKSEIFKSSLEVFRKGINE